MSAEEYHQQATYRNEENNMKFHETSTEEECIHTLSGNEGSTEDHHHVVPEFQMPVYQERTTITIQPQRTEDERVPMPVSTVNWQTTSLNHFIPLSGLDFLTGADQLIIQQTVELQDILAVVESENRYLVKVPHGETLYYAAEASNSLQRLFCGSSRKFDMKLFDQTHQQALLLRRRFACSNCCCGCYLQELEVFTAGGVLLGSVEQEWTLMNPSFALRDADKRITYVIEGPAHLPCTNYDGTAFKVLSRDGLTQVSSIIHEWSNLTGSFNLMITFPEGSLHPKMKAVFLGAGFLLEYMFFETSKKTSGWQRCCK